MRRALRKVFKIGAVAAGCLVLIGVAVVLLALFDKPLIRNIVRGQIAKKTGMTVRIGKLDYSLSPLRVAADSLELGLEDAYQKISVSVARLEARGDARKVMNGRKPAFESVEVAGLVVRMEQKAVSPKPSDLRVLVGQASDALAWTRRLSVRNARLSALLISGEADVEDLEITLLPEDGSGPIAFSVGPCRLAVRDKVRGFGLKCGSSLSGTLRTASSPGIEGVVSITSPRLTAPGIDESFDGATIDLAGRLDTEAREFAMTGLKIALPGLLDLDATGKGGYSDGVGMDAEVHARIEKLENLVERFGSRLPAELRSSRLKGIAELSGKSRVDRSNGVSKGGFSGVLSLQGIETEFRGSRLRGSAKLTGDYHHDRSSGVIVPALKKGGIGVKAPPLIKGAVGVKDPSGVSVKVRGGVSVKVPPLEKGGRGDFFDVSLDFEGVELEGLVAGTPLRLGISGRLRATGSPLDPRFSVDIRSNAGQFALGRISVGSTGVRLVGTSTKDAADITRFDATLKGVELDAAPGKRLSFENVTVAGKARLELARKGAIVDALITGIPDLAPVSLAARLGKGAPPPVEIRLESKGLEIPALRALASPFLPENLSGWDIGGKADLALEARRPASAAEGWRFTGALSLAQASFNDASSTVQSEGLDTALEFEGSWDGSKALSFTAGLDIVQGGSLWKTVYVSWSEHPLKATFSGRYDLATRGVEGLAARFLFPTIGEINVAGSLQARPAPKFDLKVDSRLSLGPLYSLTSQAGSPQSGRMRLEGTLGASLRTHKSGDTVSVEGRLTLAGADIGLPSSKTDIVGVTAEVPVHYESGTAETAPPETVFPEAGFFRADELRSPILTLKPLSVSLRAGVNAFSIDPLSVELFGGRVELGRTAFRVDPRTGAVRGAGSLVLRELDISKFPISSPQFKLTGRVRADFPRLDISSRKIAVSGRGEADIFGGKVVLRDLAVAEPFTPGRSISLNMDLLDLDLKKLTDEVPFGEVTGIVRGYIHGLVLSYGQPASFDLLLESVPRKGVPRTFSLKAVDNLTVLSSGQQASAGTSPFWMRFIRGFRYEKMGIVSTLRNDTFSLNGTIREGGVEYLVKKPPLFGINVVNRMPDKKISFKEMTGRLKRVGQSEK